MLGQEKSDIFLVYYLRPSGGTWNRTELTPEIVGMPISPSPSSQLATVAWPGRLVVYYQETDGTIQELTRSTTNNWSTKLEALPGALAKVGTGIASTGWIDNEEHIRVFYQSQDNSLWQAAYDMDSWTEAARLCTGADGNQPVRAKSGSPITAVRDGTTVGHLCRPIHS